MSEDQTRYFVPSLMPRDPAAIAAAEGAKARIQAAYIMALQRPRSEEQARSRILEACKRPLFAERVEYAKPVGGRTIKGPSVRFAELALREWQNVLTETQVIYEDDEIRRIRVMVLDLETNSQFSKDLQIRKTVERKNASDREVIRDRINTKGEKVFIVAATDDELQNKEAALISKAFRTEGLRLIPSDIVDEAIDVSRNTLRDRDAKDPKEAKKKLLDAFDSIGIKPKEIERYLVHSLDTVSPLEMETLRGIYRAIRDGETSWFDYVRQQHDQNGKEPDELTAKLQGSEAAPGPEAEKQEPKKRGPKPKVKEDPVTLPTEPTKMDSDESFNPFVEMKKGKNTEPPKEPIVIEPLVFPETETDKTPETMAFLKEAATYYDLLFESGEWAKIFETQMFRGKTVAQIPESLRNLFLTTCKARLEKGLDKR